MSESLPIPAPAAPVDDEPEHLRELTELQAAFVVHYVAKGGEQGEAARAAGYAESSADVAGSRLMRNPKVLRAIYEESVTQLGRHVPKALAAQAKLMSSAKSEMVKHLAAKDVLDRAGFTAPKKIDVGGGFSLQIDLS